MKKNIYISLILLVCFFISSYSFWTNSSLNNNKPSIFHPVNVQFELVNNKTVKIDVTPFELCGGFPAGGVYSGNGVDGNIFAPLTAGVGTHTITYSYKGKMAFDTITVLPPDVKLALPRNRKSIYVAFPPFELSGGMPLGGEYSGEGVRNNKFYPEEAGGGKHQITYTYYGFTAKDFIEVNGPKKKDKNYNCPHCHGTDRVPCSPKITCGTCNGNGRLWVKKCSECEGSGRVRTAWKLWMGKRDCPNCNGTGDIYRRCPDCKETGQEKCPKCKGTGYAPCPLCN